MLLKPISRRRFLRGSATLAAAAAATTALPAWMPRFAFAQADGTQRGDGATPDVLISIFLRGGADALNMVVPYGDDAYYTARPQLAIPRPDTRGAALTALDLDGFFGLHPALAPLLPIVTGGQLIAVQGTGAPHGSRSHFEAMDSMERGAIGGSYIATGWIGRHLATVDNGSASPLRAVGFGTSAQATLRGPVTPVALRSIVDYHLGGDENGALRMASALNALYALEDSTANAALSSASVSALDAIDLLETVNYATYRPQNGVTYPDDDFGLALRQTAALIRADVGLEAACIDLGGWDTHATQGGTEGEHADLLAGLAAGLAAFHADMQPEMGRISVVVVSEFGRRVMENNSAGTDHGAGGALWVMSGGLLDGTPRVVSRWVGLQPDNLDRGDVPITIDYRDVLAELIAKRLKNPRLSDIFPDFAPNELGLFRV